MLGKVFKQNYVMLPFACGTTNCQQLLSNVSTNINSKVNIKKCMYYHCANTVISPNFMVWKFCGKVQFPHSFGRFARNYAEIMPFHRISTPGN